MKMAMDAKTNTTLSPQQLIDTLHTLGVPFLHGGRGVAHTVEPDLLLASLATSPEARLRLAIIPLLLTHPTFADAAVAAVERLPQDAAITLRCYYTAAYWLQEKYRTQLAALLGSTQRLPDLFGAAIGMARYSDPDAALRALAVRQQVLSGRVLNWAGTYEHAVQTWLRQRERDAAWNH